jgi:hypothetical protein
MVRNYRGSPTTLSVKSEQMVRELAQANENVPPIDRPLNRYERMTIIALIAHCAYMRGAHTDDAVVAELTEHFGVMTLRGLRHYQFNAVIVWLCAQN